ncbi:septum formation initiator family protein [Mangrovibacterium marinum]|uniref:Septum formation initiator n=1 Tax=Mangrovibacterium marinum TaxID=1639118 RepID=A0A2T5BZX5_9BACT|nr:septum formation initiator family protein [Mangrovibacterium marinum]PTN07852.1 septum formation initiator [Mangrovibacterium marinum]
MLKTPKWIREQVFTKWGVVTLAFAVYILVINEHNVWQHLQNKSKLKQLTEQKDLLREKIEADKTKIEELQTSQKNLEKFAREQFLMHKQDEDVFVVVEK